MDFPGDASPTPGKGQSSTARRKEFKSAPVLETKGKFIREGVTLHRQTERAPERFLSVFKSVFPVWRGYSLR